MPTKSRLKSHLICKGCGAEWEYKGLVIYSKCPYCGKKVDARNRAGEKSIPAGESESLKKWKADAERLRASGQRHYILSRKRAFFKICGSASPKCVRCQCDDLRLLEINHKDPATSGGKNRTSAGNGFLKAIINGKHPVEGLELLCRPCNAIHYLEFKFGMSLPMKVVWYGSEPTGVEDLSLAEEEKLVTVQTFTRVE